MIRRRFILHFLIHPAIPRIAGPLVPQPADVAHRDVGRQERQHRFARGGRDGEIGVVEREDSMMYLQETLQNDRFRIYRNSDLVGCELGGALKNPIALCCGIVEGMGLGDNTIAALMTRGLAEITRLGVAMGGKRETFDGLSGVGDLIVTCTSSHSRNHRAGLLIGQGIPAAQAVKQVGTVEGYQCAKIAYAIAREHNVQVPIIEQLCEVCYNGQSPLEAVSKLMGRPSKAEEEIF